jgi:hypothetical protein
VITSQSPEPRSVSGAGLNKFVPHPCTECGHSYRKHCRASWRLCNFAELAENWL